MFRSQLAYVGLVELIRNVSGGFGVFPEDDAVQGHLFGHEVQRPALVTLQFFEISSNLFQYFGILTSDFQIFENYLTFPTSKVMLWSVAQGRPLIDALNCSTWSWVRSRSFSMTLFFFKDVIVLLL